MFLKFCVCVCLCNNTDKTILLCLFAVRVFSSVQKISCRWTTQRCDSLNYVNKTLNLDMQGFLSVFVFFFIDVEVVILKARARESL